MLLIGHMPGLIVNGNFDVIECECYREGRVPLDVHIHAIVVPRMTFFVKEKVVGNSICHFLMVIVLDAVEIINKNLPKLFPIIGWFMLPATCQKAKSSSYKCDLSEFHR